MTNTNGMSEHEIQSANASQADAETRVDMRCPHCKSMDLWENNVQHVRLRVTRWDVDGEPDDFGEQTTIDDTIRTVLETEAQRYYCGNCDAEFDVPEEF